MSSEDSDTVTAPPPPVKYREMKGNPSAWQLTATFGKGGTLLSIPKSEKLQNAEAWEKLKYVLAAAAVVGVLYMFSSRRSAPSAPTK